MAVLREWFVASPLQASTLTTLSFASHVIRRVPKAFPGGAGCHASESARMHATRVQRRRFAMVANTKAQIEVDLFSPAPAVWLGTLLFSGPWVPPPLAGLETEARMKRGAGQLPKMNKANDSDQTKIAQLIESLNLVGSFSVSCGNVAGSMPPPALRFRKYHSRLTYPSQSFEPI
ncbi:hypothetical protein THAOC_20585 [Thalassiosira oceanica]|uniref:Uncharacterized protein n=1 Tax=Thalassiosira oceanica TaxID=159749 RepID=K0S354_THAOC|nr:hypothetical protein THAOC_20585 [Thalassiosira oceanica]|eukprot:EJK59219.1 hypothetical protein THAOC_20585 [Thalassiosira oceanica]